MSHPERPAPATAAAGNELQPGDRIGVYIVRNLAGRGRTATVYLCNRDHEEVAVKVFHDAISDDPDLRQRVGDRADLAAGASHRHLLRIQDWGIDDDRLYVVTA
ncbi:MAG TPA: hypothetical protein VFJ50_09910, partial [Gemmatimonadales bacterium]|nr:hypothetical protein [Gemmatimonadales bacterium]